MTPKWTPAASIQMIHAVAQRTHVAAAMILVVVQMTHAVGAMTPAADHMIAVVECQVVVALLETHTC